MAPYLNTDLNESDEFVRYKPYTHTRQGKGVLFLYFVLGGWFGVVLVKAEVVSWFRIQEMFRFDSFHMYGVIGSAVVVGMISLQIIKKLKVKAANGEVISIAPKTFNKGKIYGSLLFGIGWAITGACPGPVFAQIGAGFYAVTITLLSAIAGTWVYGLTRRRLPH